MEFSLSSSNGCGIQWVGAADAFGSPPWDTVQVRIRLAYPCCLLNRLIVNLC